MIYGLPSFLLIFPLTWWLLLRIVKAPVRTLDVEPVRVQLNEIGSMSRSEREILVTLAVGVVLLVHAPANGTAPVIVPVMIVVEGDTQ